MIEINSKNLIGYKFIDLFSGIGEFHYASTSFGAECVFDSEWDVHAAETYNGNFNLKPQDTLQKLLNLNIHTLLENEMY